MSRFKGYAFTQLYDNAVSELFMELSRCVSMVMRSIDGVATSVCGKKIDPVTLAEVRALAYGDHAIYEDIATLRATAEALQDALESARESTADYALDFDGNVSDLTREADEGVDDALFFMLESVPEARW